MTQTKSTSTAPHAEEGARIRAARLRAGLSHDSLGALVGSKRWHLIKLEKGLHKARPALLEAIARETGTTVEALEGPTASSESDEEAVDILAALDPLARLLETLSRLAREGATT